MKSRFFLFVWTFVSDLKRKDIEFHDENFKFVHSRFMNYWELFSKDYLISAMTYNTMYFCVKNWELSNVSNNIRPLVITLNKFISYNTIRFVTRLKFINKFVSNNFFFKRNFYLKLNWNIEKIDNFFFKYVYFFEKLLHWRFIRLKVDKLEWDEKKKKKARKKIVNNLVEWKSVKCFLLVRCTWNNFFVTVIDNKGQTLVSWSGGNSERTGSRQWGTVFSADSAIYEACYMAKEKGVESLAIHVWSTFWLPQIKNCFEGLETSGLVIDELVYWPLKEFGGCWKKKPRRV